MKKIVLIFFMLIIPTFVYAAGVADYSAVPLFLNIQVKPNVLIILDDSNSMDEDFMGNAVGSYDANSKAVVARNVLLGLINSYKDKMRIGLMGYRIGTSVSSYRIHNFYYFTSYDPKSYCPNPPPECVGYCQTNDSSARTTCQTACQAQNAAFDVDYFDGIRANYSIGSDQRDRYCGLVYPKTQRKINPTDASRYLYYKQPGPFYASSDQGTRFSYSTSYNANENTPWDNYNVYSTKTGTADDGTGYSNYVRNEDFTPTDTDYALGYYDFGRRVAWNYVGRTWFKNSSPGGGYLHVSVNDVAGSQLTNLLNKLSIQDETGYMSCTSSDKDTCSYMINAGLTPIAGTLQDSRLYFTDGSTPIQYSCQKSFIIFVTDGLPSVDKTGAKNLTDPDALMPEVLTELDSLRDITVTVGGASKKFDVKTYVVGVALTDQAKTKLDDMAVHAGTAVSGRAFYADNPTELEASLNTIFADVVKRTASASAVSVLSTSAEGEGGLCQAYFTPSISEGPKDVNWIGYEQFLFIDQYGNIREDTASANRLVLADDDIIRFRVNDKGDTVVDRYEDKDSNGEVDGGPIATNVSLSDIKPIWEAGKNLALRTSARNINTYTDVDGWIPFTTGYAGTLRPYLNVDTPAKATDIINFIRGGAASDCTVLTCRDRSLTVNGEPNKIWKLGDIVYSTPTVVGRPLGQYHLTYGDTSYLPFVRAYKDRKTVVYVGANDGMLHAFSAGKYHEGDDPNTEGVIERGWYEDTGDIGQEIWGYIPYNLLPHLQWLTGTDYTKDIHVYYVDLKSKVEDVRIFSGGDHPNGWGSLLIGGMRLGGGGLTRTDEFVSGTPETRTFRSSFFALDVTNPSNTTDYPKFLWEYTDSNLGFTTSYPAIARIEEGGTEKWFAIVGSGPTGPYGLEGGSNQHGYIYVIDLSNGSATKIDTGLANAFMSGPITIDIGLTNSVAVVYIGATYDDAGVWRGKIFRLETGGSVDPGTWTLSTFINLDQPVTAAPSASLDSLGHLWLFWGTGRYLSVADKNDIITQQRLYGAWDPRAVSDPTGVSTDPIQVSTDLVNVTDIIVYEGGYTQTTGTMFQNVLNTVRSKKGWYVTMPAGERSFVKPTVIGDIVLFPSFKPTTDVCGYGGDSYLYALYYETGTAYWRPSIGFGTGTIDIGGIHKEIRKKTVLGPGLPTGVVIHSGRKAGVKGMIQLGTGVVEEIALTPPTSPKSQVIFWREKAD